MESLFDEFFLAQSGYYRIEKLMSILELIVGRNFENRQDRGNFYFRYPVTFEKDGKQYKTLEDGRMPDISLEMLDSVQYVIGANSLHIGRALLDVLKFLEYRYIGDLDFSELERKYQSGYYLNKGEQLKDKIANDIMGDIPLNHIIKLDE